MKFYKNLFGITLEGISRTLSRVYVKKFFRSTSDKYIIKSKFINMMKIAIIGGGFYGCYLAKKFKEKLKSKIQIDIFTFILL